MGVVNGKGDFCMIQILMLWSKHVLSGMWQPWNSDWGLGSQQAPFEEYGTKRFRPSGTHAAVVDVFSKPSLCWDIALNGRKWLLPHVCRS